MSTPTLYYSYAYYNNPLSGYIDSITNWSDTWLTNQTIDCDNTVEGTESGITNYTYTIYKINAGVFDYLYNNSQGSSSNASCIVTINVPSGSYSFQEYAFANLPSLSFVGINGTTSTFSTLPTVETQGIIGDYCFYNCTSLPSFIIPGNINNIQSNAFNGCTELTYVKIAASTGSSLTIQESVFYGCTSLNNVQILATSISFTSSSNATSQNIFFNTSISYLLCTNSTSSYVYTGTIPSSNTTSDSVTTLVENFYSGTTTNWTEINYVTYPDLSYNEPTFNGISNWNIYWDTTLSGESSFNGIIDISNNCSGCTEIYSNALNTSSISPQTIISTMNYEQITTIYLPSTTTTIGSYAFSGLTSLTSIIIPANVTTIGTSAFYNCSSLNSLEILGTNVTIGDTCFYDTNLNYLLCTKNYDLYTYNLTIGTEPTSIIQNFYNSSIAPSGWVSIYNYPKYVYPDLYGGSGMSFTTSYNSTDASNTYISSTYGNVAINAFDSTNSIYLGCTDCSSNVNNNLGNTVNDVYMGGNLTVDSSLNVGSYATISEDLTVDGSLNVSGYATISEDLTVDGSLNLSGTLNSAGPVIITGYTSTNNWYNYDSSKTYYSFLNCANSGSNGLVTGTYSTSAPNYWSITNVSFGLIVYNGRILCNGELDIFSDIRIKQNILDINPNDALDIVRILKPKTYSYIDTTKNNKKINYGFVAQEVDNVFSDAIIKKKEFIPNIYDIGDVINKNTIKLNNKFTSNFEIKDNKNIKIKLFFINDKEKIVNLKEIIDDKIFTIDENLGDQPVVFVYGQEVEDFHVMEKNAIFTLTTSAVKQLDIELQETKKIINLQQEEINELKKQVNELMHLILNK